MVRVADGDTFSSLAAQHGLTTQTLLRANPALQSNPNMLNVGDEVFIPRGEEAYATASATEDGPFETAGFHFGGLFGQKVAGRAAVLASAAEGASAATDPLSSLMGSLSHAAWPRFALSIPAPPGSSTAAAKTQILRGFTIIAPPLPPPAPPPPPPPVDDATIASLLLQPASSNPSVTAAEARRVAATTAAMALFASRPTAKPTAVAPVTVTLPVTTPSPLPPVVAVVASHPSVVAPVIRPRAHRKSGSVWGALGAAVVGVAAAPFALPLMLASKLLGGVFAPGRTPARRTKGGKGGSSRHYTVVDGDTVKDIARRVGLAPIHLARWNQLRAGAIHAGERLTLAGPEHKGWRRTHRPLFPRGLTPIIGPVAGPAPSQAVIKVRLPKGPTAEDRAKWGKQLRAERAIKPRVAGARARPAARFLGPVREGFISSGFGARWGRMHNGVDVAADYGTPVLAADDGVVTYAGWMEGYGNLVMIDHAGGYSTRYGHLHAVHTRKGKGVIKGTAVAAVGSTGNSSGAHLHFELRKRNAPRDPLPYVSF